jgi:hypothetical protein
MGMGTVVEPAVKVDRCETVVAVPKAGSWVTGCHWLRWECCLFDVKSRIPALPTKHRRRFKKKKILQLSLLIPDYLLVGRIIFWPVGDDIACLKGIGVNAVCH